MSCIHLISFVTCKCISREYFSRNHTPKQNRDWRLPIPVLWDKGLTQFSGEPGNSSLGSIFSNAATTTQGMMAMNKVIMDCISPKGIAGQIPRLSTRHRLI
jgi:hypothetical protein